MGIHRRLFLVVAATNQDLESLISEGRFRHDLYYRLRVVSIAVPPLRERGEDVVELAHFFLGQYSRELNLSYHGLAPETIDLFRNYSWPGNVRELQGVIKEAMLRGSGPLLLPEFLPSDLVQRTRTTGQGREDGTRFDLDAVIREAAAGSSGQVYDRVMQTVEKYLLTQILRQVRGHQANASELLGITRTTLRNKLRELGIAVDKVVRIDPNEAPLD